LTSAARKIHSGGSKNYYVDSVVIEQRSQRIRCVAFNGLISENNLSPTDEARKYLYAFVTEVLMNPAHAGLKEKLASELVENFLVVLNEVRGDLSKYARVTDQPELARYFTRAIEALNKNVDEGVDNLADLKFTSGPLKVLVSVYGAGGIDAVKGLRNMKGSRKEALNLSFEVTLSYLEKIDYSKFDDADLEAIGTVFKRFGGNINESQGAIGEMLTVFAMQKLGKTVSRIQERIPITGPGGKVYAHRVSDMFIDGVFADVKTVTPEGLAKLMQFGTRPGAVIEDSLKKSGQLFRDLIDMGNNPDTRKILVLPPHAKDRVSEVKNAIFNGAGSPGTRNELMKMWGLDPGDAKQVEIFETKLESLKINFEVVVLDV
jgi:hypothetical protein|tara:strand:- start:3342 stop:4466 length:1125 start_codon:yes stop_codon:yes gene_type:complete